MNMKENEKVFLSLVEQGVFKLYKNGNIYRCKRKIRFKDGYKDCKLQLMETMSRGYIQIEFRYNDKIMNIRTHRAIWLYFKGEIFKGLEPNHKNAIKDDNRLSNLELLTHKENLQHAHKNGLIKYAKGENSSNHILTERKILRIKKLLKEGITHCKIAKIFDVSRGTITHINTGRNWHD